MEGWKRRKREDEKTGKPSEGDFRLMIVGRYVQGMVGSRRRGQIGDLMIADSTLQNDCVGGGERRIVISGNFILFIPFRPNEGFRDRRKEGGNPCYDWLLRRFEVEVVGKKV